MNSPEAHESISEEKWWESDVSVKEVYEKDKNPTTTMCGEGYLSTKVILRPTTHFKALLESHVTVDEWHMLK